MRLNAIGVDIVNETTTSRVNWTGQQIAIPKNENNNSEEEGHY